VQKTSALFFVAFLAGCLRSSAPSNVVRVFYSAREVQNSLPAQLGPASKIDLFHPPRDILGGEINSVWFENSGKKVLAHWREKFDILFEFHATFGATEL
jgi:hypothetical protein